MNAEDLKRHFSNTSVDIENILKAQDIARACLEHMKTFLRPGLDREDIHEECARYMTALGSQRWWIHDDPALILFGDMTAYSGREDPSPRFKGKTVQNNDLITIDVAPTVGSGWGDLARSFVESFVAKAGYRNLDYHGNYGHTIENDQKDRVTIDKGVDVNIASYNKPITFEPHICKKDGSLGIKHEIMYVFYEGKMRPI